MSKTTTPCINQKCTKIENVLTEKNKIKRKYKKIKIKKYDRALTEKTEDLEIICACG